MKCGKELTQLDRGAYRKFVNRGSTSFLCKSCLAEKFGIKECVLDEKIEHFRKQGCTLFICPFYETLSVDAKSAHID